MIRNDTVGTANGGWALALGAMILSHMDDSFKWVYVCPIELTSRFVALCVHDHATRDMP